MGTKMAPLQVVGTIFDVWWKVFNERPKVKINKFRHLFSWVTIGWHNRS
jgi:hypothetical protein